MRRRWWQLLGVFLLLGIFGTLKFYIHNFQSQTLSEENSKSLAIMLNDGDGEYKKSYSNSWPEIGYVFNAEKSNCVDQNGNIMPTGTLIFNQEKNSYKITTQKSISCYLYFDKKELRNSVIFFIGGSNNPSLTKTKDTSVYIKWQDNDITHYCINEQNSSNLCNWQEVDASKEINATYTLNGEEGIKTLYVFLKDAANNITNGVTDSITLKSDIKGTFDFYIGGDNNPDTINNFETDVYLSWEDEDVTNYCILDVDDVDNCNWKTIVGLSVNTNYTLSNSLGEKKLYAYIKDKYGFIKSNSDTVDYVEN